MTKVDRFLAEFLLFGWDVKLQESETDDDETSDSFGGLFIIQMLFLGDNDEDHRKKETVNLLISRRLIECFYSYPTAKKLIVAAVRQLPSLNSCTNLDELAASLTRKIYFHFCFKHESISSPKPIFFVYGTVILGDDHQSGCDDDETINRSGDDHHSGCDDDETINHFVAENSGSTSNSGNELEEEFIINLGSDPNIYEALRVRAGINVEGSSCSKVPARLKVKSFGGDDDDSQESICPICLETIHAGDEIVETACSHVFHPSCIYKWLDMDNTHCPVCRSSCRVCFFN